MNIAIENPYSVHKDHENDVLLYNGRLELPRQFSCDLNVAEILSEYELKLFSRVYDNAANNCYSNNYFLKSIPQRIQVTDSKSIESLKFSFSDIDLLSEYYVQEGGEYILLDKEMTEFHQRVVISALEAPDISESDRFDLSILLEEKFPMIHYKKRYAATMFNDAKHYFFYRKSHEHVPGIMLMEVGRQAVYADLYKLSGLIRSDVAVSMMSFNTEFIDFINLQYPVFIYVENGEEKEFDSLKNIIVRKIYFIQNNKVATIVTAVGSTVAIKVFKRFRTLKHDPAHQFSLVNSDVSIGCHLKNLSENIQFDGKLETISERLLTIKVAHKYKACEKGDSFEFYLFAGQLGSIVGKAICRKLENTDGGNIITLDITEKNLEAKRKIIEFIKTQCYISHSCSLDSQDVA